MMRTTLDLDDDVLAAVKERADVENTTAGKILSELVRKAILDENKKFRTKNGFPVFQFPRTGKSKLVTMDIVNRLRDDTE